MVSQSEMLRQGEQAWPRFLRSLVSGEAFFPLTLRIGKTRRAEDYGGWKKELTAFRAAAEALGLEVEWREVRAPRFGTHARPDQACWRTEESFVRALGKTEATAGFHADIASIRATLHRADDWLVNNVLSVLANHGDWPALMRVVCWFVENPRCGLYLRQLPIEGVDTKFFETRTAILDSLLLYVNPNVVNTSAVRFEERHGLRWEQPLIRLRFLDATLQAARGFPVADLALPAPAFRQLPLAGSTVIITENLRNFLSLPQLSNAIAVFGGGNAIPLLGGADWLANSRILYWGDIDSHGFLILDRLRGLFSQVESFLMDAGTLDRWKNLAGNGPAMLTTETPWLNSSERKFFERIAAERFRLEQERIPFDGVVAALVEAIRHSQ